MKLAHIKDEKVIRTYHGTGRVTFENGDTVSPPTAGVHGNERLVPVVDVTVDNSKTTRTKSSTVETVEADRVLRTVTTTDVPIEDIRAGASLDLIDFITALVGAGILPPDEGVDAAKGNWPATFAAALAGMPDAQKVAAQIQWAAVQRIRRNHPLIAMLAAAARLSDAQVDSLFGMESVRIE